MQRSTGRVGLAGLLAISLVLPSSVAQSPEPVSAAVPAGFQETIALSGLVNPSVVRFSPDGRVFVAEKSGLIKAFSSLAATTPTVVADLRTNVHNFWDRGLLGMALSPTFPADPYIYVLYTYDHILGDPASAPRWGSVGGTADPCPNPPGATGNGCVVSGRLSRLQISGSVAVGAEQVLIEDWCQQFPSHSIGALAFGGDGMLYVSSGDGASFNYVDYGQSGDPVNPCGDPPVPAGVAQTIPTAEGGALRSQAMRGSAAPSGATYRDVVLADGPVGYWRLGETTGTIAADVVGAEPGTYTGGVSLGRSGAVGGDANKAVDLDGSTGYVRISDRSAYSLTQTGALTIEAWVAPGTEAGDGGVIVGKGTGGNYEWALARDGSAFQLTVWSAGGGARLSLWSTSGYTKDQWHHVAAVLEDGVAARIYVNGTLQSTSTAWSGNSTDGSSPIDIGRRPDGQRYYQGGIDEVAIYGRALSADDVTRHHQAGRNGSGGGTSGAPRTLDGTILRVDPSTGAAAPGNPKIGDPDPNVRRVIAYGLRNPFRIAARPGTNELWLGDVGWNAWEEINRIPNVSDAVVENFGWPCYEGGAPQSGYDAANLDLCESLYTAGTSAITAPSYAYSHSSRVVTNEACPSGSSSIAGLAFYPESGGSFPAAYRGGLFFSDYSRDCIWFVPKGSNGHPDFSQRQTFVSGAANPVDLVIGPNGDLFYADFDGGTIRRVSPTATNQAPTARIVANPTSGPAPLTVQFDGTTSSDPENGVLTYSWDLNGDGVFGDSTAATPSFQYTGSGVVTASLRVTDPGGAQGTASQTITVGAATNTPPVPTIGTPSANTTWAVNDSISFSGSATDTEDGVLAPARLSWSLVMHHCPSNCHTHPVTQFSGVASGSFVAPDHEYPSYLELTLTATDSAGASASATRRLDPRTVDLTFQSSPSGLQLVVGATTATAPFVRTVIVGSRNSISAPSPQVLGGTTYTWEAWSDGGARSHDITAGTSNATYSATFSGTAAPSADVSVTKSGVGGNGGKSASFTIVVRNNGPSTAAGVTASDVLASGTSFAGLSTTAGTCSYSGGSRTVSCAFGDLANGASATVTIDVTMNGKPKHVENTVTVSSATSDPNTANNTATVRVTLR